MLTNGPYGGRVRCFGKIGTILFVGTDHGVFRSTDNGRLWIAKNTNLYPGAVNDLATVGTDLYAGTNRGVYRSVDSGTTWMHVRGNLTGLNVESIGSFESTLIAWRRGIRSISTDYGATWIQKYDSCRYLFDKGSLSGRCLKICSSCCDKVLTDSVTGLPTRISLCDFAMLNFDIYTIGFSARSWQIYRSTDNGFKWSKIDAKLPPLPEYVDYIPLVDVFASDGSVLYLGSKTGLYRSTDSGTTWEPITTGLLSTNICSFAVNDSTFFVGTLAGGIYRSVNRGTSWEESNVGLTNLGSIELATLGDGILTTCNYATPMVRTTDNGTTWHTMNSKVGLSELPVHSLTGSATNMYVVAGFQYLFHSNDGGINWTELGKTPRIFSSLAYVKGMIVGSISDSYTGKEVDAYCSRDSGRTWLPVLLPAEAAHLRGLASDSSNIFSVGDDGIIYRLADDGSRWIKITSCYNQYLEPVDIGYIQSFIIVGSRYFIVTNDALYCVGSNGPATVLRLDKIKNIKVNDVVSRSNVLFAASDHGIFHSGDYGNTWVRVNTGLTDLNIDHLAINDTYIFATARGSVWRRALSDFK